MINQFPTPSRDLSLMISEAVYHVVIGTSHLIERLRKIRR